MLKNLAVIKFFLDRIMYIYIILLFTCSFILCFLVVHEGRASELIKYAIDKSNKLS
jgi:preprotein translocase subunit SecG